MLFHTTCSVLLDLLVVNVLFLVPIGERIKVGVEEAVVTVAPRKRLRPDPQVVVLDEGRPLRVRPSRVKACLVVEQGYEWDDRERGHLPRLYTSL